MTKKTTNTATDTHFNLRWWANEIFQVIFMIIFLPINLVLFTKCPGCDRKTYRWRSYCYLHDEKV